MDTACTQKQNGRIHALFSDLGWNEFVYGSWLKAYYHVECPGDLTGGEASRLIRELSEILKNQRRNQEAGDGERMITSKQETYLKTLWLGVDYSKGDSGDKHLSQFLLKRFRVRKAGDLTCRQAIACIAMIKSMIAQAEKRAGRTTVLDKKSRCRYCDALIMWVQLQDGRRMAFDFDDQNQATNFHECVKS
ncbi:MAG: DUF1018 domain-containing protein [Culturomica sp.]|jgi:hypothetical protein|nr:DUF1018 domain-containing protein [Culturomica sp.]